MTVLARGMKECNGWQTLYRCIPREKNQDEVTQYISGVTCGPPWPSTVLDKGVKRHRLPRWLWEEPSVKSLQ